MRKWREIDSLHFLILSLFPPSFSISKFSLHLLPLSPFPTSKCVTFCCKMLNTALLSRMSQKSQHTCYEEIILGRTGARKLRNLCRPGENTSYFQPLLKKMSSSTSPSFLFIGISVFKDAKYVDFTYVTDSHQPQCERLWSYSWNEQARKI